MTDIDHGHTNATGGSGTDKKWKKEGLGRKQVESVMEYLRAKHFTVDGFLKGLFEAREDGYLRQWTAAKKVMYTDAEIVQTLTNDEQATFLETTEWSPVRRIFRREMLTLTRTPQFGKFNPEDCRTPIEALMNETELQRLAPHLIDSIYQACEPNIVLSRNHFFV